MLRKKASQAEAGLAALRQELFPAGQSLDGDLRRLLTEEESWQFLLRLSSSLSAGGASNFVLLMMLSLVQSPQMILETQGMHELLVEKLTDRQDPELRGMAAKQLLELYRETQQLDGADADLLGRAVASSAMEALSLQEAKLQTVTAGCQEASGRHSFVSQLEKALTLTTEIPPSSCIPRIWVQQPHSSLLYLLAEWGLHATAQALNSI
eukprot:s1710_g9.t1